MATYKIYIIVRYTKHIPILKPKISPILPTTNGTIAPPIIPVQNIPDTVP